MSKKEREREGERIVREGARMRVIERGGERYSEGEGKKDWERKQGGL